MKRNTPKVKYFLRRNTQAIAPYGLLAHVLNMELKGLFRFNVDYGSVTQLEPARFVSSVAG